MQPHSIVLPTPPLNQDLRLQVRVVDLHFQAILVRDARRDPTDLFEVVLTPTPSRIQQLRYGRSSLQAGMKKNPEISWRKLARWARISQECRFSGGLAGV